MLAAPSPFSFILFGASGHLARIKIYPAFYVLALKKRLPKEYAIVGFSRSAFDDDSFRKKVEEAVREDLPEVNEKVLSEFLGHCFYHQGQYDKKADFEALGVKLDNLEKGWSKLASRKPVEPVRLAYLSIPPSVFSDVLGNLCAGGVHHHEYIGDFRCIVEKPVGHDLDSANEILEDISKCFPEEEIYLLDHYLGKEAVRNIFYLRFANPMLERVLKNTLIHHVEVTAMEDAGLEGRAGYFEAAGTFLDMFQSHLLMTVSLLSMRLEDEDDFRASRLNALEQFYLPPMPDMNGLVLQAQYEAGEIDGKKVSGYLEEEGVAKDSKTNTYAALKLMSRTSRWQGVPFYLRSGKRLGKKETRISIEFQEPRPVGEGASPNRLDIILQGEAGMKMYLQTKIGGTEPKFRPLVLDDPLVCVGDCLPEHGLLLLEAIHGKQQWYLSFEEVRTAWRLVDPIQTYLTDKAKLHHYKAGTDGPKEAQKWIKNDGIDGWFTT